VLVNRASNFEALRCFPFNTIGKLTDRVDVPLRGFQVQAATIGLAPGRTFRNQPAASVFIEPLAPELGNDFLSVEKIKIRKWPLGIDAFRVADLAFFAGLRFARDFGFLPRLLTV
jgi:hypothetical protein